MSAAKTELLSGAIALRAEGATLPVVLLASYGGFQRLGFGSPGSDRTLMLAFSLVAAGFAAYGVFRWTFNALCERWSEGAVPTRIRRPRFRRDVVRTSS